VKKKKICRIDFVVRIQSKALIDRVNQSKGTIAKERPYQINVATEQKETTGFIIVAKDRSIGRSSQTNKQKKTKKKYQNIQIDRISRIKN
jgi:hypothetical protein